MAPPWLLMSPSGILHFVRDEDMLRQLQRQENLTYDKLAKHVCLKQLDTLDKEKRPAHVKGWRLLRDTQWLQKENVVICVFDADAKKFIKFANSCVGHPICGAFHDKDATRLAHLLNSGWVWSNNARVDQMHGWKLLREVPANAEKLVLTLQPPSPYAPEAANASRIARGAAETVQAGCGMSEV